MPEEDSKVDFRTERLYVYRHDIELPNGFGRSVYHAWLFSENELFTRPACSATVHHGLMDFLEWVEVTAQFRRRGFATELLRGIQERYGLLVSDGVTPEGVAFVDAWDKRFETID